MTKASVIDYYDAACPEVEITLDIRMTREEITAALPRFKGNGSFGNTAYDVDEYTAEEIMTQNFL